MILVKLVDVAEGVHVAIGAQFPYCNALVLVSDTITVIDPGCPLETLRFLLRKIGKDIKDIDFVVLSHIHPDHITHAARIERTSRCRIVANDITAPLFDEKEKMKQFLGFHKGELVRPLWENLVNERIYGALDEGRTNVVVKDQEELILGDHTLKMVYTPGHLPDHMCIELGESNLIFAADIDCTEFGPFYGHPNSSIQDFKQSIELLLQSNYDGLVSGHLEQPLLPDFRGPLKSYLRQFDLREDLVLLEITGGARTLGEIMANPLIYPSLTNPVFLYFEKWMIEHHIQALIEKGKVWKKKDEVLPV
ncbi:MAG: MBL fold metallo-hydrolase [Candidatus Thorarchaeota archaeon]|jgi:glyoxylase-like metal-dependent hydrolase (beta-lactamase superfamily II)